MFEEYWVAHPEALTSILPSYHIGYGSHLPRLERAIRDLHKLVGNAEVDGREIVIGVGSTELISATLFALSLGHWTWMSKKILLLTQHDHDAAWRHLNEQPLHGQSVAVCWRLEKVAAPAVLTEESVVRPQRQIMRLEVECGHLHGGGGGMQRAEGSGVG